MTSPSREKRPTTRLSIRRPINRRKGLGAGIWGMGIWGLGRWGASLVVVSLLWGGLTSSRAFAAQSKSVVLRPVRFEVASASKFRRPRVVHRDPKIVAAAWDAPASRSVGGDQPPSGQQQSVVVKRFEAPSSQPYDPFDDPLTESDRVAQRPDDLFGDDLFGDTADEEVPVPEPTISEPIFDDGEDASEQDASEQEEIEQEEIEEPSDTLEPKLLENPLPEDQPHEETPEELLNRRDNLEELGTDWRKDSVADEIEGLLGESEEVIDLRLESFPASPSLQRDRMREQLARESETSQENCAEELAKIEADGIHGIDLSIRVEGNEGEDYPFECLIGQQQHQGRHWPQVTYNWKAAALSHKPLYFEQVHLERYGHSWGPYVQPLISGAHFFGTLPVLPYKMGLRTPTECVYTLGYYRPGSCAPYMIDAVPFTWRAALFEAGAATGMSFVIP